MEFRAAIRSLGEILCPPRDNQRGGLMKGNAVSLGKFVSANHGGIRRIALVHLDAPVMGAGLDNREGPGVGQAGEHSAAAHALGLQPCLFLGEIQLLDGQRFLPSWRHCWKSQDY